MDNSNTATDAGTVNTPAEETVDTVAQSPANPPSQISQTNRNEVIRDSPPTSAGNITDKSAGKSRHLNPSQPNPSQANAEMDATANDGVPNSQGYITPPGQDSVMDTESKPAAVPESNVSGTDTTVPKNSMMAGSPLNNYTISVMGYMILIGFLVTVLLGGAFVVLNVGLLSKREEDKTGMRDPSDVGVLKAQLWPEEDSRRPILPAEEDEDQQVVSLQQKHLDNRPDGELLSEDKMKPAA